MTIARVRASVGLRDLAAALLPYDGNSERELERVFAEEFEFEDAVFLPYGRSAVFGLCRALNAHEVACPAYTCAVVPGAAAAAGAINRFVDSAPNHFLPDSAAWEACCSKDTDLAIITPLFGYPLDLACVDAVKSKAPRAFVLLDEAQSYSYENIRSARKRIDGVLLSLGIGKLVSGISGGILLLHDEALGSRIRSMIRGSGALAQQVRALRMMIRGAAAITAFREPALTLLHTLHVRVDHDLASMPPDSLEGLPSIASRLALRQIARLPDLLGSRRRIGEYYERRLGEEGFMTFDSGSQTPTWVRYPLAVAERDYVTAALHREGIQVARFLDYSCPSRVEFKDARQYPHAALWAKTMINLPTWPGMREDQAERVIAALKRADRAAAWPSRTEATIE